mmetsp:Transcript_51026/g.119351  ORF Transcript_51026/g.119351 Transcript_51026/m.119351 type:complete len:103 (-) Transcript_51026:1226-1534(-)
MLAVEAQRLSSSPVASWLWMTPRDDLVRVKTCPTGSSDNDSAWFHDKELADLSMNGFVDEGRLDFVEGEPPCERQGVEHQDAKEDKDLPPALAVPKDVDADE